MKRNRTPVLMVDAAFCSREESTTVVIGVSPFRLFGLFGLSRLFGFGLNETNQMNQINQINETNQINAHSFRLAFC